MSDMIQRAVARMMDRGVMLSRQGDDIEVDAPEDALTDGMLDFLYEHKDEILEVLKRTADGRLLPFLVGISEPGLERDRCADCGYIEPLAHSLCFECASLRLFLDDYEHALMCECGLEVRRWRYPRRPNEAPGFKWYCGNCLDAPRDAIWSKAEWVS